MLSTYHLALLRPLRGSRIAELRRRIYYLDEAISSFELVFDGDAVSGVRVRTDRPCDGERLIRELRSVVEHEIEQQLDIPPKVVWRADAGAPVWDARNTFETWAEQGLLHEIAPGQVALAEPALSLLDALDRRLRDMALALGGCEYRYPALVPLSAMRRSGYLGSFPQHMMFAVRLRGEMGNYRDFGDAVRRGEAAEELLLDRGAAVDRCLPPTMCYHTFHQFGGRSLPVPGTVVTARGPSFRHEARYHRGLERLSDFTIREIVFMGTAEFARARRGMFMRQAQELVDELGLSGRCEVASDPFFAGLEGAEKTSSQRLLELKYELHLDIGPGGESVAVASFNLHHQRFGEAFGITDDAGRAVHSSCVGFGLERLALAVLSQFGADVDGWPPPLRRLRTGER